MIVIVIAAAVLVLVTVVVVAVVLLLNCFNTASVEVKLINIIMRSIWSIYIYKCSLVSQCTLWKSWNNCNSKLKINLRREKMK